MATIPFYTQQVSQDQARFGRVREQDVSSGLSGIAQGLQDVGEGMQAEQVNLARMQHQADLEADKLEIAKRNSQADIDLQGAWSNLQNSYKEGDQDLPEKFFSYYKDYTKSSLEGLKTQQGKDMLSNRLEDMRANWGSKAVQWQAQENARSQLAGLDSVAENYKKAVIQNPASAQQYAAQYKADVDGMNIAPEYKREAIQKTIEGIAFTAEQAIADKNPGAPFKQGSRWSFDALDADKQLKLMDFATQRQRQYAAEARQSIALSLGDVQAQLMDGVEPTAAPSNAQIIGAFGADKAAPIIQRLSNARQYGQDVRSFAMMPPEEIQKTITERTPTATQGYANAAQVQDQRIRAAQQVLVQRNKAPADYLLRHSPDVAQSYNQMAQYIADPNATPEQRTQSAQIYATKSLAQQNELGVLKPQVLPEAYEQDIVAGFYQQQSGGENAATLIEQQQQLWGAYWPKIMQQMGTKLPKEAQVIASGVPKDLSERLASTSTLKDEQLYQPLQKGQKAEIQQSVADALQPFAQSLQGQTGGQQTYSTFYDAATRATASYVLGGMDPKKAAQKVADGMINQKYEFFETYRVPKAINTAAVRRGAEATLQSFPAEDLIALPGVQGVPEEVNRQQLQEAVRTSGQWVPNSDETGLSLTVNGYRVLDKAGQPIVKTWNELIDAGTVEPGKYQIAPTMILPGSEQKQTNIGSKSKGMVEQGNIDLDARPVVQNADGSISTVRSMSFQDEKGGPEILIPTVSNEGTIMSDREAIDYYRKTGQFLGKFDNPDDATAYAESLHNEQAKQYGKKK